MTNKKNEGFWVWIIIVGFIVISKIPVLIPFLIIGFIVYFSTASKGVKGKQTFLGKKKIYGDFMNSDIVKDIREKNPEIFKNIDNGFSKRENQLKHSKSKLVYSKVEPKKSKIQRKSKIQNVRTTSLNTKPYKSSFSTKMKKAKTYDYNDGKSIWDNYESVVDKMNKNK